MEDNFLEDLAGGGVEHMQMCFFKGGHVQGVAIRREREAITSALVSFFPNQLARGEVVTTDGSRRGYVEFLRHCAGANAFDVGRTLVFVQAGGGEPFEKRVALVDVENQDAVAAVFEV